MQCVENYCSRIQTTVADIYAATSTFLSNLANRIYAIVMNCLETVFCYPRTPTSTVADVQNEGRQVIANLHVVDRQIGERLARVREVLADPNPDFDRAENELREIRIVQGDADRELARIENRTSAAIARLIPLAVDSRGYQVVFDSSYQPEVTERMRRIAVPLMPADVEEQWTNHVQRVNQLNRGDPLPEPIPVLAAYLEGRIDELEREAGIRA